MCNEVVNSLSGNESHEFTLFTFYWNEFGRKYILKRYAATIRRLHTSKIGSPMENNSVFLVVPHFFFLLIVSCMSHNLARRSDVFARSFNLSAELIIDNAPQ